MGKKHKKRALKMLEQKHLRKSHNGQISHSKKQQRETEMTVGRLCMAPCAGHGRTVLHLLLVLQKQYKTNKTINNCVLLGSSSVEFGELTDYSKFK